MEKYSEPKKCAALQRSLTELPSWRDNSGVQLIRCGALQLQLPGAFEPERVPMIKGAPSTLLVPPAKKSKKKMEYFPRVKSPERSRWTKQSPEEYAATVPASLRDRLALTRRLEEPLRDECLKRLDDIIEREPEPRRLSHCDDDERFVERVGTASSGARGGESSSDAGEAFAPADGLATMLPPTLDAQLQKRLSSGQQPIGGEALQSSIGGGAYGAAAASSPSLKTWRIDQQVLSVASRPDVWRVRPMHEKARTMSSCTGEAVLAQEAYPTIQGVPGGRSPLRMGKLLGTGQGSPLHQSAPNLPVVGTGGVSAHTAVAAAKEELDMTAGGAGEDIPVRGAQSLLRTSLRYMLQF